MIGPLSTAATFSLFEYQRRVGRRGVKWRTHTRVYNTHDWRQPGNFYGTERNSASTNESANENHCRRAGKGLVISSRIKKPANATITRFLSRVYARAVTGLCERATHLPRVPSQLSVLYGRYYCDFREITRMTRDSAIAAKGSRRC